MKEMTSAVIAAAVAALALATVPANAADPASSAVLRNQTRIIGDAVRRQVRQGFVASKHANIRSGPTASAAVIGQYPAGSVVAVTGGPTDGWYEVAHGGRTGYVWAALVDRQP